MAAILTSPVVGAPGEVHSTLKNPLMTIAKGRDANGFPAEYIYLSGVASTVAGSWVAYDEAGITLLLDSDVAGSLVSPVAVATAIVDAATKYGWYQIAGNALANVHSAVADNAKLYAQSTPAGEADDAAVTGNQIHNAFTRAATTTAAVALSSVQIDHPFIGVADAII